jgi:DNA-binding transcriptional MocR family regulator
LIEAVQTVSTKMRKSNHHLMSGSCISTSTVLFLFLILPAAMRSSASTSEMYASTQRLHHEKRLNENTVNPLLKKMEYAVRGEVVVAADKIAKELESLDKESRARKYKFDKILYTNIGNPQSVGQTPLTWPRQVMALVNLPESLGIDHPFAKQMFPLDAIDRAREIKAGLGGHGLGAYSHSQGVYCFRKDIAEFIEARDGGIKSNPDDIFMTNGASSAIHMVMTALARDNKWQVYTMVSTRYFSCTRTKSPEFCASFCILPAAL